MSMPAAGRIVSLVGFMGAGKSEVGLLLAGRLGRPFLDLDGEISRRTGRSPAAWIRERGEEAFRLEERAVLEAVLREAPARPPRPVLACGGGVLTTGEGRRLLMEETLCIWLDLPLEQALERVRAGGADRPLLEGGPEAVRRLYEERRPCYAGAHLRVPAGGAASGVAREAERALREWREPEPDRPDRP
jgi:shikimate kinase